MLEKKAAAKESKLTRRYTQSQTVPEMNASCWSEGASFISQYVYFVFVELLTLMIVLICVQNRPGGWNAWGNSNGNRA